jgi:hypothetical protein
MRTLASHYLDVHLILPGRFGGMDHLRVTKEFLYNDRFVMGDGDNTINHNDNPLNLWPSRREWAKLCLCHSRLEAARGRSARSPFCLGGVGVN